MKQLLDRGVALGRYFSPRVTNYSHPTLAWNRDVTQQLAASLSRKGGGQLPSSSPLRWATKADFRGPRDEFGLPIDYRSSKVFAIDAAQYVLGVLDANTSVSPRELHTLAEGLLSLAERVGPSRLRFRCMVPAYYGEVGPGWCSAMAQGQMASALLRLGRVEEAEAAVIEMLEGPGYIAELLPGHCALKECVSPRSGIILNGHLIALIGLAELAVVKPKYRPPLTTFVSAIGKLSDLFVQRGWSFYELGPDDARVPASAFYHHLHAGLFLIWAELADSVHLRALAEMCRVTDLLPFRLDALVARMAR